MVEFTLNEGENLLGKWTLNHLPPTGGRYTGVLTVTDERLLFDARYDTSLAGAIDEAIFFKRGSEFYLQISKTMIKNVEVSSSFFSKKVLVTLNDGSVHTFHYGMLSVAKIAEAIRVKK